MRLATVLCSSTAQKGYGWVESEQDGGHEEGCIPALEKNILAPIDGGRWSEPE